MATLRGIERRIEIGFSWGPDNATCRRLITIAGYRPILSSAMPAMVVNSAASGSGRHFSASLGLVPRQDGRPDTLRWTPKMRQLAKVEPCP